MLGPTHHAFERRRRKLFEVFLHTEYCVEQCLSERERESERARESARARCLSRDGSRARLVRAVSLSLSLSLSLAVSFFERESERVAACSGDDDVR